jgi:hypothetical protein
MGRPAPVPLDTRVVHRCQILRNIKRAHVTSAAGAEPI